MSNTWGNKIKISIFGESHGEAIGVIIAGLKPGFEIDMKALRYEVDRRKPGSSNLVTQRNEDDEFKIMSGVFNGKITGAPLMIMIENKDASSKDYDKMRYLPRPSHSDLPAFFKYEAFNDYRGGGHFSGRLTATLVLAGAIAKQIIAEQGVYVGAHISSVGDIEDYRFDECSSKLEKIAALSKKTLPLINEKLETPIKTLIETVKHQGDSIGGSVECIIKGIKAGEGEPFFDSFESVLSHLIFSIPAVKGIEFGEGFGFSKKLGSQVADEYYYDKEELNQYKNSNGGIIGGLTSGSDVIFRVAVKPTPTIAKELRTVNLITKENEKIAAQGRHDPCIVIRIVPVIEAVAALVAMDFLS